MQSLEPELTSAQTATAGVLLQDMQPGVAQAAADQKQLSSNAIPNSLNVCCNGNFGIYLLARRGVQCLCLQCSKERAAHPNATWIMSPTEFERHSGMPSAKKWRVRCVVWMSHTRFVVTSLNMLDTSLLLALVAASTSPPHQHLLKMF